MTHVPLVFVVPTDEVWASRIVEHVASWLDCVVLAPASTTWPHVRHVDIAECDAFFAAHAIDACIVIGDATYLTSAASARDVHLVLFSTPHAIVHSFNLRTIVCTTPHLQTQLAAVQAAPKVEVVQFGAPAPRVVQQASGQSVPVFVDDPMWPQVRDAIPHVVRAHTLQDAHYWILSGNERDAQLAQLMIMEAFAFGVIGVARHTAALHHLPLLFTDDAVESIATLEQRLVHKVAYVQNGVDYAHEHSWTTQALRLLQHTNLVDDARVPVHVMTPMYHTHRDVRKRVASQTRNKLTRTVCSEVDVPGVDYTYVRQCIQTKPTMPALLSRIQSPSGFVETPSPLIELMRNVDYAEPRARGYATHTWFVWTDASDNSLHMLPKLACIEYAQFSDERAWAIIANTNALTWNNYYEWSPHQPFKLVVHNADMNTYVNLLHMAVQKSLEHTALIFPLQSGAAPALLLLEPLLNPKFTAHALHMYNAASDWVATWDETVTMQTAVAVQPPFRFQFFINDWIGLEVQKGKKWEPHLEQFVRAFDAAFPLHHIVDIGANFGYHTLWFAQMVHARSGQVYAFEPQIQNFTLLANNVHNNNSTNVHLFQLALTHERADVLMPLYDLAPTGPVHNMGDLTPDWTALPTRFKEWNQYYTKHTAPAIPLDALTLPPISMIKVDVQGWELRTLQGARDLILRDRPLLLLELETEQLDKTQTTCRQVVDYMKELGYTLFLLHSDYACDNVGVHNSMVSAFRATMGAHIRVTTQSNWVAKTSDVNEVITFL